ncbi:MAG TPA: hypothetical protein VF808_17210 [Ktedonobacterales bacterium]
MSYRNPDDLDGELEGLFARATAHVSPRPGIAEGVERRVAEGGSGHSGGSRRGPALIATLSAVVVVALLVGILTTLARKGGPNAGTGGSQNPTATTAITTFSVSDVTLSVSPASIAGQTCGATDTFTYTAVFHIPAGSAGGTIKFNYTLNNGRSQTLATVTAPAWATSVTYTFISSGALPADHTYPAPAQVMVTSPNSVLSNSALPSGSCAAPSAFQVTSVSMAVSPPSIAGLRCGTQVTVTYTATFHLAPSGPGGTLQFLYTVNNGRGDNPARLSVAPGQTTATYQFQWAGPLPPDHTYPEAGGVMVTSPNSITSPLAGPSGTCS